MIETKNGLDQLSTNKSGIRQARRLAIFILPILLLLGPVALPRKATAIGTERNAPGQHQSAPTVSTTGQRSATAAEPTPSLLAVSRLIPRPTRRPFQIGDSVIAGTSRVAARAFTNVSPVRVAGFSRKVLVVPGAASVQNAGKKCVAVRVAVRLSHHYAYR